MRDLTEEELKLAPDWVTHYFIDVDDDVIYESINLCWWKSLDSPMHCQRLDDGARPLPTKPFDISEHEFYDCCVKFDSLNKHLLCLNTSNYYPELNKDDAIAIAKALGVTGEDLK